MPIIITQPTGAPGGEGGSDSWGWEPSATTASVKPPEAGKPDDWGWDAPISPSVKPAAEPVELPNHLTGNVLGPPDESGISMGPMEATLTKGGESPTKFDLKHLSEVATQAVRERLKGIPAALKQAGEKIAEPFNKDNLPATGAKIKEALKKADLPLTALAGAGARLLLRAGFNADVSTIDTVMLTVGSVTGAARVALRIAEANVIALESRYPRAGDIIRRVATNTAVKSALNHLAIASMGWTVERGVDALGTMLSHPGNSPAALPRLRKLRKKR